MCTAQIPNEARVSGVNGVSIVVATYNQAEFIGRCLRSLVSQNVVGFGFEIIVIDDGSTDSTTTELEKFAGKIRKITLRENRGLPTAANLGIKASRFEYIVRVDSDDFVNSNFLHFLRTYLEMTPEADAVACDYLLVGEQEEVIDRKNCDTDQIACGVMFRKKSLLSIGGYDEEFLLQEDKELMVRFREKHFVHRLPIPLYRYRRHQSNMTNDEAAMGDYEDKLLQKHKPPQIRAHQEKGQ